MFKYSQWHEAVNTFKFKGHLKKGSSVLIVLMGGTKWEVNHY